MKSNPRKKLIKTVGGDSVYHAHYMQRVYAVGNATVVAHDKSMILATGNSVVRAHDSSTVIGTENATIVVYSEDCKIELCEFAVVVDRVDGEPILSSAKSNVVNLFTENMT